MGCCIVSWGFVSFHRVLYYFMGCCIVSWGVVLFHGVLYCFIGWCIVSWGVGGVSWGGILFHGVFGCFMGWCCVSEHWCSWPTALGAWFRTWTCFMGCWGVSWGVGVFQSTDVPGQQLWGRGSGHGAGGRGPAAAGAGHQGAPVLHRQPGARQVGRWSAHEISLFFNPWCVLIFPYKWRTWRSYSFMSWKSYSLM